MIKVSFVIPNYNGRNLLEENLPKVIKAGQKWRGKFEIIIVDDASSDDSAAFLKKNYSQIKLVTHKKNKRFATSCNDGVNKAHGEIVILLNNDVVPEKNFLKPLLRHFQDSSVFAVGCKEKALRKGKIVYSGRALGKFERGFLIHRRAENQELKTTLWVASGSAAYRKSIWQKLGGLDNLYRPAYGEDIDISYRALKSGWKVIFEPHSLVFHQHKTTNEEVLGEKGIKTIAFKNQILFVWKNITDVNLLFNHFLWLPYHLLITSLKTKGLFFLGFIQALWQLPQALSSRKKTQALFKLSDKEILENYV